MPEARPASCGAAPGEGGHHHRDVGERHPDRRHEASPGARRRRSCRRRATSDSQPMPAARTREAGDRAAARSRSGATTPAGDADHQDHDRRGHRQQRGAGLEGAVAEHLLQVEVEEEPHRDPGGAEQRGHDVRRRRGSAHAEDRRAASAARGASPGCATKPASSRARRPEREQGLGRGPADLGRPDDAEHRERDARR